MNIEQQLWKRIASDVEPHVAGRHETENLANRIMADVGVALVLARREGWALRADRFRSFVLAGELERVFPFPSRTVEVLREEEDPNGGGVLWRWSLRLEYRQHGKEYWTSMGNTNRVFAPYRERVLLWADLIVNPTRTEAVEIDPENPWPEDAP